MVAAPTLNSKLLVGHAANFEQTVITLKPCFARLGQGSPVGVLMVLPAKALR